MAEKFKNKYRIATARAPWHDYKEGVYFITINTQKHRHYFGKVVRGQMCLNRLGSLLSSYLEHVALHHPYCKIPHYVVMPNHWHAIVLIDMVDDNANSRNSTLPSRGSLSTIIRNLKSALTNYAHQNDIPFAWQPRYHDCIITNNEQYERIAKYIKNNPIKWSRRYQSVTSGGG